MPKDGCGCGGKQWTPPAEGQPGQAQPTLRGNQNPQFTWPPKANGPQPKTA